jgi:hypothetical protein
MTISPNEAGAMLADVDVIIAKVKQSRTYRLAASILILWDAIVVAGYFWSGEWFDLWLALVNGGGFVLCGLAMRRA